MSVTKSLLLDTSIWIDFFRNQPTIVPAVKQKLVLGNIVGLDVIFG